MGEVVLEAEDVKKVTSNNNHGGDKVRVASRPISGDISIELETPAGDKRRSAAADISQFRAETSPASYPTSISHMKSSSLLQESSNTKSSSVLQDSSKSASSHQGKRSQSRTSRVSSRTSSRLDTTGSSGILNSSYKDHHHQKSRDSRSSYYFGEAPDFKDILANVNGNHAVKANCDSIYVDLTNHHGPISPHTGEVSSRSSFILRRIY